MEGILYLVATPIGNLDDITLRAIKTLEAVDYIAAEDTRHTLKILNHLNISKPLISCYKENELIKSDILISKLKEGKNIALVSDAGTPVISDPGEELVHNAIKNNIKVVPIPGACALITALIASGISAKEFCFVGFLPVNKTEKTNKLLSLHEIDKTLIFYEAPHKLLNTLTCIKEILGNRKIAIARELTKIHEEFIYGYIDDILNDISNPKGEFVLIVEGNYNQKDEITEKLCNSSLEEHFSFYNNLGYSKKDIIKLISKDRNVPKNDIYQYFINK